MEAAIGVALQFGAAPLSRVSFPRPSIGICDEHICNKNTICAKPWRLCKTIWAIDAIYLEQIDGVKDLEAAREGVNFVIAPLPYTLPGSSNIWISGSRRGVGCRGRDATNNEDWRLSPRFSIPG
ncbi:hypothetical protein CDAR_204131 [Caerostris darwini]|uniref:Uncharacterized protein n=1 Tax=Caerostris darwini TaxID=1538125 RepID=A0AAV4QIB6_9ARAC|nr:hypothetical protein CDAR_204131 [Caerostris darwini]